MCACCIISCTDKQSNQNKWKHNLLGEVIIVWEVNRIPNLTMLQANCLTHVVIILQHFEGNSDSKNASLHQFPFPVHAQFVKLFPEAFNIHPHLRWDFIGCIKCMCNAAILKKKLFQKSDFNTVKNLNTTLHCFTLFYQKILVRIQSLGPLEALHDPS